MNDPVIIRNTGQLAALLRARRRHLGQTQLSLSVRMRTSPQRVTEWETGRRIPHAGTLLTIADALGYDLALIPREDTDG